MTDSTFLPLSKPSITTTDLDAVSGVLRSGWITTGAKAAEFEARFCDILGCQEAVALSSATAGMHLLLHAMGIGPGDEVITPSMTWVSTVNLITACGATPVFADVDCHTLMTSAAYIAPLITGKTKLILPVHFAGAPLDLDELRRLSNKHTINMVEDAAHALGTFYKGSPIGQTGTNIFSFHPIKNITTGEGGMFCTQDGALAEHIRRLKFHGLGVDAYDRHTQSRAPQAEVLEPGFKYNLPDMNAVLGISQLTRLESMNRRRAEIAALYDKYLAGIEEIDPLHLPDYEMKHAWHLYIIRLDIDKAGMTRSEFMEALKAKGIGSGLHFKAVHTHKYYREKLTGQPPDLPNTEWNSERICSLPLYPDMHDDDTIRVVNAIKSVLQGN